jgi:hypothetical protein
MSPSRKLWRVDWNTSAIVAVIELAPKKERTLMFLDSQRKTTSVQFGSQQDSVQPTPQPRPPPPSLHGLRLSSVLGYQAHCFRVYELSEVELFTPTDRSYIAIFVHPIDSVSGMELFAQ